MSYSIQNINSLPSIKEVKKISQGLALVDAILMPEWEDRFFSFNNDWDGNKMEAMASMKDGTGNEYFINFTNHGVAGKVLYDEQLPTTKEHLFCIPDCLSGFKGEHAFNLDNASFFFWRERDSSFWESSPNYLVSYPLLGFLVGGFEAYMDWAENYYEKNINRDVLKDIFTSLKVNNDQLSIINADLSLDDIEGDIKEIV